jgi:hypothetical protein
MIWINSKELTQWGENPFVPLIKKAWKETVYKVGSNPSP